MLKCDEIAYLHETQKVEKLEFDEYNQAIHCQWIPNGVFSFKSANTEAENKKTKRANCSLFGDAGYTACPPPYLQPQ